MTAQSPPAIEAVELTRSFGETLALDHLSLRVPQGGIYGVLGANGAGKTTLIRILATLLRPHGGSARVFGHDVVHEPDAVRQRVSLTGQFASLDTDLTVEENLVLLARLLGLPRADARARTRVLLNQFDLPDAGARQVAKLSGGMLRRVDIAASLIRRPDLLFLDEPTTGLDPRSRRETWKIVRAIVTDGTTVVLTTQYLNEADHLCDRIAVVDHGRVIAEGTNRELKASAGLGALRVRLVHPGDRAKARELLARELGVTVQVDGDAASLSAQVDAGGDAHELGARATRALAELAASGVALGQFSLDEATLDDAFLALTGDGTKERLATEGSPR